MKYLQAFEALASLIPKKVTVYLVDAITGEPIGRHKVLASLLPGEFNKPTNLLINHTNWRVRNADPVTSEQFLATRKLTLRVQPLTATDLLPMRHILPTIANNYPVTIFDTKKDIFTLELNADQWRQVEFLCLSQKKIAKKAITAIETILKNQEKPLLGYSQQYIRDTIPLTPLEIPMEDFCLLLTNPKIGYITAGEIEFIENGFAIQTDNHIYYGLQEQNRVRVLCLPEFDYMDEELLKILSTYDLLLIDWCNASRLSAEPGEPPKSEYVKL